MPRSSLRRITPYLSRFKPELTAMFVGALGAQVVAAILPLFAQKIIDDVVPTDDRGALWWWSFALLTLGLLEAALLFVRRFVLARAASVMEMRMRHDLYAHLQRLPLTFHDRWQTGQLLSRAMSDTNVIYRNFVSFAATFLVANVAMFVVAAIVLTGLNPWMALLVGLSAVPLAIAALRFRAGYRVASRSVQDAEGDLGTWVEEVALGLRTVITYGRHDYTSARFADMATRTKTAALHANRIKARFSSVLTVVTDLSLALVLGVGAIAIAGGALSVGGLVAFLSLMLMLVWPVQSLGEILAVTHEASTGAQRIYEVFDETPSISAPNTPVAVATPRGHLQFRGVGHAYPGKHAVDDVSFELEPGETVAIVGRTGSGKSTLCAMPSRLVDPTSGVVLLDGVDVRDWDLTTLRSQIAVTFEDPLLFSASVEENLLLGNRDADRDEVHDVLHACAAEFLLDLPWGLQTRIGEQGISLSGGQRQRLALARAIICNTPVLILDDPLSALDVDTEARVHAALAERLSRTTTLITAHRPSTVALADRVVFMVDGHVEAIGTHPQLLAAHAAYRETIGHGAEELV